MSRFLELLEQLNPETSGDPKWALIDFLKSKGIHVSLVKNTDMLYIDTGHRTVCVTVSNKEEESQESDLVNDISKDDTNKLQPQAAQIAKQQQQLAPKAIQNAKVRTQNLQKELQRPVKPIQ